jgi:hypothetical protein
MFPAKRDEFLKCWTSRPGTVAPGYYDGNQLQGFGVRRTCREGFKIGPLFANDPQIAEALFQTLIAGLRPGQPVFLDVPEVNRAALDIVIKYKMTKVFETARMYSGKPPAIEIENVFGVNSYEPG